MTRTGHRSARSGRCKIMAEAKPILMPKFGQTVEEATIVKWHKAVGDEISKGDILFEIETDKAVLESESFVEGTLLKVIVAEGDTAPVQTPVAFVGAEGDDIPEVAAAATAPKPQAEKPAAAAPKAAAPATTPAAAPAAASAPPVPAAQPAPAAPAVPTRKAISPRAKSLARKKVIKTDAITGTGPNGRVVEKDVIAYLEASDYGSIHISPAAKNLAEKEGLDIIEVRNRSGVSRLKINDIRQAVLEKPKPMSKMRQVIAQRLTQSFRDVPHFYVATDIDMTDLLVYRKQLKESGMAFTVTDFIMEAVILTLKEFDVVNSSTDGANVWWHSKVQLGLAVSIENGLVVPVIRNAEDLTMTELHDIAAELAKKAREGKLTPDEMQGGTFTISNMGMLGVNDFNAIINPGEGAILAVASTKEKPVARDGQVVIRSIMNVRLSVDHRIVDGAVGAAFVNSLKDKLEDVELWKSMM